MPGSRPRILIVNAYFDDTRRPTRRATTVLRTLAPTFLAGAFSPERFEIRLWDEDSQGPLLDRRRLGWPDMLVLTGLTAAFDRMRQLAAYAKTLDGNVIVVAGGPAVRTLPRYSARFFDHACTGDVEQMADVVESVWGAGAASREMVPRYDITPWMGRIAHAESSRNCNFACSFCSMTAEGNPYTSYGDAMLDRHLDAVGRRRLLVFADNNFYGNDRRRFLERVDAIGRRQAAGQFKAWAALVTSDFFRERENVRAVKAAGCTALFCGVESFDVPSLERFDKRQNTVVPQIDLIRGALDEGVLLLWGMLADVENRPVAELRHELELIIARDEITLPTFVVLPIPFPGTPFFRRLADEGRLLPDTRIRDLDGTTLSFLPRDDIAEVAAYAADLKSLRGHRRGVLRHARRFWSRYRGKLDLEQRLVATARDLALAGFMPTSRGIGRAGPARTHVSTTDPLDRLFTPAFPVDARYTEWFEPTFITDGDGRLNEEIADELMGAPRAAQR